MLSPTIETERLILRRIKESDLDAEFDIVSDKRLQTYIKFPQATREEELEWIRNIIKDVDTSKHEFWVIELKESADVVGNISVNHVDKIDNYCSVGYVVRYDFQGNGYAAEALKAVSDYLLNDREYYLVECVCNELNKASSKTMLNAGFSKDGYVANRSMSPDGTKVGLEYYSKTKQHLSKI